MAIARSWLGTPYHHQASLRGVGCDCLGLLRGIWREIHGVEPENPPAYTSDWAEVSGEETLIAAGRRHMTGIDPVEAGPGDVLMFRWRPHLPAKHVGLLCPDDCVIHAQEGVGVVEFMLSPWWRRHVAAAFRFPVASKS